jgi:hypothetical protein
MRYEMRDERREKGEREKGRREGRYILSPTQGSHHSNYASNQGIHAEG